MTDFAQQTVCSSRDPLSFVLKAKTLAVSVYAHYNKGLFGEDHHFIGGNADKNI